MQPNNRFNTNLPILESLAKEAESNNGNLPDYLFSQCCTEYGIDEDKEAIIMQDMMDSKDYKFMRKSDGWSVIKK